MSVIKVNQITNRDGSGGPIISGLTTVGVVTSALSVGTTNLYVSGDFVTVSVSATDVTASGSITGAQLSVSGLSTFTGSVDANGGLDINGNTTGLNATGVSTFVDVSASQVSVSGVSTFTGNVDLNGGLDINGTTTGLNVSGVATATTFSGTNVNLSGVGTITNLFVVRSDDGTPGRIDYYCESSNAHYTRIQAAPHSEYSGNVTAILPTISGDIIIGDNASQISQSIWTSGIIQLLLVH